MYLFFFTANGGFSGYPEDHSCQSEIRVTVHITRFSWCVRVYTQRYTEPWCVTELWPLLTRVVNKITSTVSWRIYTLMYVREIEYEALDDRKNTHTHPKHPYPYGRAIVCLSRCDFLHLEMATIMLYLFESDLLSWLPNLQLIMWRATIITISNSVSISRIIYSLESPKKHSFVA